jgi:S1-C subfamily serine protease
MKILSILIFFSFFISCNDQGKNSKKPNSHSKKSNKKNKKPKIKKPLKKPKPKLTLKQLLKTTVTITGTWLEKDVFSDDKGKWFCSGVIISAENSELKIITNKHCSGLEKLSKTEPVGGAPDVSSWSIKVYTAKNKVVKVDEISLSSNLDLAVLKIYDSKLKKGKDFLIAPKIGDYELGDEVIAIGSPVDPKYAGTLTFGKISAIRKNLVQHDAALNPGNSGGPLYKKTNDSYRLIAINTFRIKNRSIFGPKIEGLNFAISVKEISNGTFFTAPVNKKGACKLIKALYKKKCNVD